MGITLPVGLVMNGSSRLFWGQMTNYLGAVNTMVVTSLGAAFSLVFWGLTLGSPLCGFLSSTLSFFFSPAIYACMAIAITRIYGEEQSSSMFALFITGDTPGAILGAPLLNMLSANFGWANALYILAAAPFIMAV